MPYVRSPASSRPRATRAGRVGLIIPPNYRIPPASIISRVFHEHFASLDLHADERLGIWTSSTGSSLRDLSIHIEVRKYGDQVRAIITLN